MTTKLQPAVNFKFIEKKRILHLTVIFPNKRVKGRKIVKDNCERVLVVLREKNMNSVGWNNCRIQFISMIFNGPKDLQSKIPNVMVNFYWFQRIIIFAVNVVYHIVFFLFVQWFLFEFPYNEYSSPLIPHSIAIFFSIWIESIIIELYFENPTDRTKTENKLKFIEVFWAQRCVKMDDPSYFIHCLPLWLHNIRIVNAIEESDWVTAEYVYRKEFGDPIVIIGQWRWMFI